MHLVDPTNDNNRRKASLHYSRMAKHAQRQRRRDDRWRNFASTPYFAFVDMILCALLSAIASASIVYLLLTVR